MDRIEQKAERLLDFLSGRIAPGVNGPLPSKERALMVIRNALQDERYQALEDAATHFMLSSRAYNYGHQIAEEIRSMKSKP
jgi:hypothetical protein